jgi:hypothetical protein
MHRFIVSGSLAFCCAWVAPAHAQSLDSVSIVLPNSLRQAQNQNQLVRIQTESDTIVGRVSSVSKGMFRLGQQKFDVSEVRVLEIRFSQPDPIWNGALLGGSVGALAFGAFLILLAEGMSESPVSFGSKMAMAGLGGLVGTFFGGGVDAALEQTPVWRTVYERRP